MNESPKVKAVADIVFLIDVTGSMGPFIEALKTNINRFIDTLTTGGGPNEPPPVKDWRGMVVGYRDVLDNSGDWFVTEGFTNNVDELRSHIALLEPDGGGDIPESLLDAIHKIAWFDQTERDADPDSMLWRYRSSAHRFILAFTDAVFHKTMSYDSKVEGAGAKSVEQACHSGNIKLCIFTPAAANPNHDESGEEAYDELSSIDKSEINLLPGATAEEAFDNFVADTEAFNRVMSQLAKTVSKSVETEALPLPEGDFSEQEKPVEEDETEGDEPVAEDV